MYKFPVSKKATEKTCNSKKKLLMTIKISMYPHKQLYPPEKTCCNTHL